MKAARQAQEPARLAAVLSGKIELADAWPDYFRKPEEEAFPVAGADMTDFEWEEATPGSVQEDLAALMSANEYITLPEEPVPPGPGVTPAGDLEWM
jgi:hypothetical protein